MLNLCPSFLGDCGNSLISDGPWIPKPRDPVKKLVVLIGQRKAMGMVVRNNRTENRFSGLLARLLTGTPTFVIDGKVYEGELTLKDLDAILKPLVK